MCHICHFFLVNVKYSCVEEASLDALLQRAQKKWIVLGLPSQTLNPQSCTLEPSWIEAASFWLATRNELVEEMDDLGAAMAVSLAEAEAHKAAAAAAACGPADELQQQFCGSELLRQVRVHDVMSICVRGEGVKAAAASVAAACTPADELQRQFSGSELLCQVRTHDHVVSMDVLDEDESRRQLLRRAHLQTSSSGSSAAQSCSGRCV